MKTRIEFLAGKVQLSMSNEASWDQAMVFRGIQEQFFCSPESWD